MHITLPKIKSIVNEEFLNRLKFPIVERFNSILDLQRIAVGQTVAQLLINIPRDN